MKPSFIVHGGAGSIAAESAEGIRAGIHRALEAGWSILSAGGAALDAVEAAIVVLEDDPLFDAGAGSHLNRDGRVQLDAILMDGGTLKAGAVAAVERVRNPIRLARCILEKSPHMMLVGAGAEQFAAENGIALCDPEELISARARAAWKLRREQESQARNADFRHGTVGGVALDSKRRIAAGTSTGGTFFKYPGRVGDSPLIGCGCYADSLAGGVSCTGHGEGIMKMVMAKAAIDRLQNEPGVEAYRESSRARGNAGNEPSSYTRAQAAAEIEIERLAARTGSTGGLILLDPEGSPGVAFNTPAMSYGYVQPDGSFRISAESTTSGTF